VRALLTCYLLIVKHLPYIVAAGAIGFAVWAIIGAPPQTHPDVGLAQNTGRR
jgi:hypothetical protein